MKKDRDCGNYPIYPMQMPMMMPNNMGIPNMGMNSSIPTGVMTNINTNNYDNEIQRLEQRINLLERRINTLETKENTGNNYSNYNSSGYQML